MNWFLIALIPPALWASTNYIDKYLIERFFKGGGAGALIIFSALIGIIVAPFILLLERNVLQINASDAVLIVINGIIWAIALLPYLYALQKDDVSMATPLFQTIPIFSLILGLLVLNETITVRQFAGMALVIGGGVALSLDLSRTKRRFKAKVFGLMMLASFLVAINALIFKFVALKESFLITAFWENVGLSIAAAFFLIYAPYRRQFLKVLHRNKMSVLGLNALNEVIGITAKLVTNFATLLAPLALVWTVNSFQPLYVLTFGVALTLFFPRFIKENIERTYLVQKVLSIAVIIIGSYFLN